jgi:hypothetical protein
MSEKQLRDMIASASDFCQQHFARRGAIAPQWHAVTASGDILSEPHPPLEKDAAVMLIRLLFEFMDVVRYVYISEAWSLMKFGWTEADRELLERDGISKHPDRIEVVQMQGEDREYGQLVAFHEIIRPRRGKPSRAAQDT